MGNGSLREACPRLLPCRPIEKDWVYEIVSNLRSGIDTDKMNYFRHDAIAFDSEKRLGEVCLQQPAAPLKIEHVRTRAAATRYCKLRCKALSAEIAVA